MFEQVKIFTLEQDVGRQYELDTQSPQEQFLLGTLLLPWELLLDTRRPLGRGKGSSLLELGEWVMCCRSCVGSAKFVIGVDGFRQ